MNVNRIMPGLLLAAAGFLASGCYTQFATNERDPFAEQEETVSYTEEDTSGSSEYYDSRERFYSDYYVTRPYTFSIGISYWDPWRYPGYGYGGWWYYDPWAYPFYPTYAPISWWGGGYACYPYYYGGGYAGYAYERPSGVRTFGSRRTTGPARMPINVAGSPAPGVSRTSTTSSTPFLPGGVRSTAPRGGNVSGREGGSRPAPGTTSPPSRSGSARDASRGERMPAYTPPPPSRETPRRGEDRPSGGTRSYSPPPPPPSQPSSPPPSNSPREGGSRSGGTESSGGGRSGSRR